MNENAPKPKRHEGVGKIPGRQRVTMHDIARVAGCSQPTVSIVLNGNDSVKKIKLAPLPSIGCKVSVGKVATVATKPAAPKTDLTHSSSESSFTKRLLSTDVEEFTRCCAENVVL